MKLLSSTLSEDTLTAPQMYGRIFMHLADQVCVAKEQAMMIYKEALQSGVNPADMECDWSLKDLDLADEDNINSVADGLPIFTYYEPD